MFFFFNLYRDPRTSPVRTHLSRHDAFPISKAGTKPLALRSFAARCWAMIDIASPLRLRLDSAALVHNWRWLAQVGGAEAGAAIKADGYGLGARDVMRILAAAGCSYFFVATWAEAAALMPLPPGVSLSVLHGVGDEDMIAARSLPARPVLNSVEQVARWRASGEGRRCDVMVDTENGRAAGWERGCR